MVFEEIIAIAPELQAPINSLVRILRIAGGVAVIWLIFWIVGFVVNTRRMILLKKMLGKLEENNQKLDRLLKKK